MKYPFTKLEFLKITFKKEFINKSFTIRLRQKGDKLINGKKLKDIYIDKKIDLFNRDRAIVVTQKSIVFWSEILDINREFIEFERVNCD